MNALFSMATISAVGPQEMAGKSSKAPAEGLRSRHRGLIFRLTGTPLDVSEFQVNSYTDSYQRRPAVSSRPEGSFVVVWESYGSYGDDSSLWSGQLRRFAADGAPVDPADFQVNTFTQGLQYIPSMALGRGSDFVVAWNSTGGFGDDTSGASIQARLFAQLLFVDGFESGDTSAWSSTVP